jgi:hypothetical protein
VSRSVTPIVSKKWRFLGTTFTVQSFSIGYNLYG